MRIRKREQNQNLANFGTSIQPQLKQRSFVASTTQKETADLQTHREQAQRSIFNFADINIFAPQRSPNSLPIQPKLTSGQPNDKYEQEADVVAHQVVNQINSPERLSTKEFKTQNTNFSSQVKLQRTAASEEEDLVQAKEEQGDLELPRHGSIANLEPNIDRARGRGKALDSGLQTSMGQAMGADFSRVKIHTDSNADQMNKSIQAKAFTTGQDIFFRQGAYQPANRHGQELIAHELTHVTQQKPNIIQPLLEPYRVNSGREELIKSINKGPFSILKDLSQDNHQSQWITKAEIDRLFRTYIQQNYRYKETGNKATSWQEIIEGTKQTFNCGELTIGFTILIQALCVLRDLVDFQYPKIERQFAKEDLVYQSNSFIDRQCQGNLMNQRGEVFRDSFFFQNHIWSVVDGVVYDPTACSIGAPTSYATKYKRANGNGYHECNLGGQKIWFDTMPRLSDRNNGISTRLYSDNEADLIAQITEADRQEIAKLNEGRKKRKK